MRYIIPLLMITTAASAQQQGQPPCDSAQKVHEFLTKEYGEKPFVEFKDTQGRQMIMYVNPSSGSYTVINTDGIHSCALIAGNSFTPADQNRFKSVDPKKKEDPS